MVYWVLALVMPARRAQVVDPGEGGSDLTTDGSAAPRDLTPPPDLASSDLACSPTVGPEQCGNGCDDDQNGYIDDDDPACTPQVLITSRDATPTLSRLILTNPPQIKVFEQQGAPLGAMLAYRRTFSPMAYLVTDPVPGLLRTITLGASYSDLYPAYQTRDVCIFDDQLIVVERNLPSVLHRFRSDGVSEIMPPINIGMILASSCTSDGNQLFVSVYNPSTLMPSEFMVFDKSFQQVVTPIKVPDPILSLGFDRCIDIAWTSKGLYGLFVVGGDSDPHLNAGQVFPFSLDGAVGDPIDAGMMLHGIGEFAP